MRFLLPILLTLNLTTLAQGQDSKIQAIKQEIQTLLNNGLAEEHPKILSLLDQAEELGVTLSSSAPELATPQETILLLTGIETISLTTGKTTNLKTLLSQGWKIQNIIPAGENKAYAWLKK